MLAKINRLFNAIYEKGQSALTVSGKALLKEFWPSLVLASATFILAQEGLLDFTDYLTLSMTNLGDAEVKVDSNANSKAAKVILLTDLSYESDFNQSSPLDRKKLAEMFKNILERKPRVMAVDLDISPREQKAEGQNNLDNLLKDKKNKYETKIILITPMPVLSEKMVKAKAAWMKELCDAGVTFAYPDVHSHLGAVTKYMKSAWTLGNEAHLANGDDAHNNVCNRLLKSKEDTFLRKNGENRYSLFDRDDLFSINARSYQNTKVILVFDLKNTDWNQIENCDVVFVGGSYGVGDEYNTPSQKHTAGVIIHAATFYTQGNRVVNTWLWVGYLIDIIIGVMCGALFQYVHKKCGSTRNVRSLISNFILLFGLMVALLWVAQYYLLQNLWIQPGPMLVGMYLTVEILDFDKSETVDDKLARAVGSVVVIWGVGLLLLKSFTT